MQIRKKDYTDTLVEELFTEASGPDYVPVIVSDADKKIAEDAYLAELKNGPLQRVYYASGKSFNKPVGSFDLENFHKAYDQFFVDNNLLGLFKSDGTFTHRGTYGEIKTLDKNLPPVKALLTMWGAQFSHDMEWYTDKLARQKAQEDAVKAQEEAKRRQAEIDSEIPEIKTSIKNLIENSPKFTELVNVFSAKSANDIKVIPDVKVTVDDKDSVYIWNLGATIAGVYTAKQINNSDRAFLNFRKDGVFSTFKGIGCFKIPFDSWFDTIKALFTEQPGKAEAEDFINNELAKLIQVAKVAFALIKNYDAYISSPTGQQIKEQLSYLVYYDKYNGKYYQLKFVDFNCDADSDRGLLLIDIDNSANRNTLFNPVTMRPAFGKKEGHSSSGRCWSSYSCTYYTNSWVPEAVLKANKIPVAEQQGTQGGTPTITIKPIPSTNEMSKCFDTYIDYDSTYDSSD